MRIYDRQAGKYIEEKEFEKKKLELLYNTLPGRILLKLIFARRYYSVFHGWRMRSKASVKRIVPFMEEYSIILEGCEKKSFSSFDDFFTRKREYHTEASSDKLIAGADGRLSVYRIDEDLTLRIKNSVYTLCELTDGRMDISAYAGGMCLVYRLAVEDYHRYVFIDSGRITDSISIKGEFHTVRPVSEKYRVFSRNHRVCTLLKTDNYGEVLQIEVGALQVGKINNHPVENFNRLDEKGYFSYGGSTIIQLFKKGAIELDGDIMDKDCEVLVKIGEVIGSRR